MSETINKGNILINNISGDEESPYLLLNGFLHIPLYKPGEYLEGTTEEGNHISFKINPEPSRRAKNSKGNYSYKIIYCIISLTKEKIDEIKNPSIIFFNKAFLSFLELYEVTSSFKGIKRSRILPLNEVKPTHLGDITLSREIYPLKEDLFDLGIPKLKIDLKGDKSILDILDAIYQVKEYIDLAFYQENFNLGEIYIYKDNLPIKKLYFPSFNDLYPSKNKDEESYIPYSYLVDRYIPIKLNLPSSKGKRLILDKNDYLKEIENLKKLYCFSNNIIEAGDIPVREMFLYFKNRFHLDLDPILFKENKELDNLNLLPRFYREVRKLSLEIYLSLMNLSKEEIMDSFNRIYPSQYIKRNKVIL